MPKNEVVELTNAENKAFEKAEQIIRKSIASFLEVGAALKEIRDKKLYRAMFPTFEEYCDKRWGLARRTAYQKIEAATVAAEVQNVRNTHIPPQVESQALELSKAGKDASKVWAEVVRKFPRLEDGSPDVTAKQVAEVRDAMLKPKTPELPKPKDAPPADEPSKPVNGIVPHDDEVPFEPPPDREPGEDDGDEELDAKLGEIESWDGAKGNQLLKLVGYYENKIVKAEAILTLRLSRLFPHHGLPLKRWNDELASKARDLKRFRMKLEATKKASKAAKAVGK